MCKQVELPPAPPNLHKSGDNKHYRAQTIDSA